MRYYLDAWLPIMTSWNGRVLYIDGFAGPGRYKGGEDGSPIIALKAALEHKKPITTEVIFRFIEEREDRAAYLEEIVSAMDLPPNFKWRVVPSRFDETLTEIMEYIDEQNATLAPTFAFVDPFGYSHTPFSLIARLMTQPRCEVLINFMYEEINRFLSFEPQWLNFNTLLGAEKWNACLSIKDSEQRKQCIHDTYKHQLEHEAKIKFVRSFEMINYGNKTDYFLFFGTNGYQGLKKMKQAMWRVDKAGHYHFSDRSNYNQPYLIEPEPDYNLLKDLIVQEFKGKEFTDNELERFVVIGTPFSDTHYKGKY